MARVELSKDALQIEAIIEARSRDLASRELLVSSNRIGRRPEFRYVQALFDATFEARVDDDIIRDVTSLVMEQPDLAEAAALLAWLHDRNGNRSKALLFAREGTRSSSVTARLRAEAVLRGESPRSSEKFVSDDGRPVHSGDVMSPTTAESTQAAQRVSVSQLAAVLPPPNADLLDAGDYLLRNSAESPRVEPVAPMLDSGLLTPRTPSAQQVDRRDSTDDDNRSARLTDPTPPESPHAIEDSLFPPCPTEQGKNAETDYLNDVSTPRVDRLDELRASHPELRTGSNPPAFSQSVTGSSQFGSASRAPIHQRPVAKLAAELGDELVPEPALDQSVGAGLQKRRVTSPFPSAVHPPRTSASPTGNGLDGKPRNDRAVAARARANTRPDSPPVTKPGHEPTAPNIDEDPAEWFASAKAEFERDNPTHDASTASTVNMLLDLGLRVATGQTPLCDSTVTINRAGLEAIQDRFREILDGLRGGGPVGQRAATTAAAAFLLATLMHECGARPADTTAQDGACRAVLPSGYVVRPLLVCASFAKRRSPTLLDSFDGALSSRSSLSPGRHLLADSEASAPLNTSPRRRAARTGGGALMVPRRNLDAGTICIAQPDSPRAGAPILGMRQRADTFWASDLGKQVAIGAGSVGAYTAADVEAIEHDIYQTIGPVGLSPPSAAWPFDPGPELEETIIAWGAVLGEVVCQLHLARWEADPADPDDLMLCRVVLPRGLIIWPVAQVYLRIARGIQHNLITYLQTVADLVDYLAQR